jgi:hypothetical protein
MESKEILTLRAMAWSRAKGDLQAYLETYWPEWTGKNEKIDNGFDEASRLISEFIEDFENSCR